MRVDLRNPDVDLREPPVDLRDPGVDLRRSFMSIYDTFKLNLRLVEGQFHSKNPEFPAQNLQNFPTIRPPPPISVEFP